MKARAFTIVELLVVVSILTLLLAMLLPALTKVRSDAKKNQCASDARMMVSFFNTYSMDDNGLFPDLTTGESQLYWFNGAWRERLRDEYNLPRIALYSPNNPQWNRDDFYWYESPTQSITSDCVAAHFYFGGALAGTNTIVGSLPNYPTSSGGKVFPRRNTDQTKVTFLWADLNRKLGDGNWITTGDPNRVGSNHLNRAIDEPEGSHMGHMDGHVEWTEGANIIFQLRAGGTDYYW